MKSFFNTLKIKEYACPDNCDICREACRKSQREMPPGTSGIKAVQIPEIKANTAIVCNQCSEPICEENCPTGAIGKNPDDGVVRIDQDTCLGCGLCSLACPYGGIDYDPVTKTTFKCDLCGGNPECVKACPEGLISFEKSRDLVQYFNRDRVAMGTPLCWGCPAELSFRFSMRILGKNTILLGAPGCAVLLICGAGTQTYCQFPTHMTNMTNLPSTATGLKRYYKKMGKDVQVVCFAGDGCFADVGFQPLSGAAERGENIIVICYDNEGYMNTGVQRSGTTPYLGWTTTTPVGEKSRGKQTPSKNMPLIMAAHEIPYVATATVGFPEDYAKKLKKAMDVKDGMSYIHLFSPCTTGWRASSDSGVEICQMAVRTNIFPLWEYERGAYKLTYSERHPRPVSEYFKLMQKFRHLTDEEVDDFQHLINRRYHHILALTEMNPEKAYPEKAGEALHR